MSPALFLAAALAAAPGRAEDVVGSVVHSKDWVMRRGKEREEEFVGDVRYESAGTRLTADWALFKHATKTWDARGDVKLKRTLEDGVVFDARGERAHFDQRDKTGVLEPKPGGRVSFERTPPGEEPDRGSGDKLTWDGEERAVLSGDARVWGPRLEAAADVAIYERPLGRLTLDGGRPVLRKLEGEWTTAVKADEVVALRSPRVVNARGKVVGWLIFRDPKKLGKELSK